MNVITEIFYDIEEQQSVLATREFMKEKIAGARSEIAELRKENAEIKAELIK